MIKKTSIGISEALLEAMKTRSKEVGLSVSEIIRESIIIYRSFSPDFLRDIEKINAGYPQLETGEVIELLAMDKIADVQADIITKEFYPFAILERMTSGSIGYMNERNGLIRERVEAIWRRADAEPEEKG